MTKICFLFALSMTLSAQTPAFEVATVKRVDPDEKPHLKLGIPFEWPENRRFVGGPGSSTPDRIRYSGVTLRMLLKRAYDLKHYQISGPVWIDTELYEVVALLPTGTTAEQARQMLQTLLAQRFHIEHHTSSESLPAYNLIVGKGGPKLNPPQPPQGNSMEELRRRHEAQLKAMQKQPGTVTTRGFSLPRGTTQQLANYLSSYLQLPVIDDTHVEGLHSFKLDWNPDSTGAPDLFEAVVEQLGLHLKPGKEQIDVLVIDKADREPAEN